MLQITYDGFHVMYFEHSLSEAGDSMCANWKESNSDNNNDV